MKYNISTYKNNNHKYLYWSIIAISLLLLLMMCNVADAAASNTESLGQVIGRVESNVLTVARLMVLISYVSGVGFAMAGVLQFKAHKDNPAQVPLSKPIVYVCVGAFLLFLPQLMGTAGKSVFGDNAGDLNADSINTQAITPADRGTK